MDFSQIAAQMWPLWVMGLTMLYLTWKSEYKDQLKINWKGVRSFCKWMLVITGLRFLLIKLFSGQDTIDQIQSTVGFIPWQVLLTVFWEDACHTLPLVLLGKLYNSRPWYKWISGPLLGIVMLSFGVGHIYQGVMAAALLSFYIPVTMHYAKKHGFGTVMICHILYDLVTLLSLKWLVGSW